MWYFVYLRRPRAFYKYIPNKIPDGRALGIFYFEEKEQSAFILLHEMVERCEFLNLTKIQMVSIKDPNWSHFNKISEVRVRKDAYLLNISHFI